jgi:hypothetical protein
MVKPSSIPHQYYLNDGRALPGTIQYHVNKEDIINTDLPDDKNTCGFILCEHTYENKQRVIPFTQRNINLTILLMMIMYNTDGEIWLKTALINKDTGKIALLTSTNDANNIKRRGGRPVKTIDGTWTVGHYRMSAPICFWRELKNRLLY